MDVWMPYTGSHVPSVGACCVEQQMPVASLLLPRQLPILVSPSAWNQHQSPAHAQLAHAPIS